MKIKYDYKPMIIKRGCGLNLKKVVPLKKVPHIRGKGTNLIKFFIINYNYRDERLEIRCPKCKNELRIPMSTKIIFE